MRVAIATDVYFPTIGGSCVATRNVARELAKKGHHVVIIAPSPTNRSYTEQEGQVTVERLGSIPFNRKSQTRITSETWRIREIIARFQPDIVHIMSPGTVGTHAIKAAKRARIALVCTTHVIAENVIAPFRLPRPVRRPLEFLINQYIKRVFRQVDYVICPTQITLDFFKRLGLKVPMMAISNGIYLDMYRHTSDRDIQVVKKQFSFTEAPMLLYVGRLEQEKKVFIFVKAMGILKKQGIPFKATIIGKGAEDIHLKRLAHTLGLDSDIRWKSVLALHELVALYHAVDIFVMPSTAELQCLALLEAMSAHKPAVAANALALPQLVHDGVNGYLFRPNDPQSLFSALSKLLSDSTLRVKMGNASFAIAETHDMPKVVGKVEEVYQKALAIRKQKNIVGHYPLPAMEEVRIPE